MAETNDQHAGNGSDEETPVEIAATDVVSTTPTERPIIVNQAGLGSMIAGGVIAAAIGAAGALTFLPEGWRRGPSVVLDERVSALEARPTGANTSAVDSAIDSAIAEALAPLAARIATLEGHEDASTLLDPLNERLSSLETQVQTNAAGAGDVSTDAMQSALTAAISPLSARLNALESDLPTQTRAAVNEALADSRAEIEALAQSLVAREESVEDQQARIAQQAALDALEDAASSGQPAPEALDTLAEHGDVPQDLALFADGIPTLAALQDSFPAAARAALADAPAPEDLTGVGDRVMNFLRHRTGARSLAPREGDDTDAVLSRAEAALRNGDIRAALDELAALPEGPAAATGDWRGQAETRLAAMDALREMNDELNGNGD